MYLLVFVTLVVALTGIYAEVLALQTRQLYGHQTTIAAAMQEWHAAAVAQAEFAVSTTAIPVPYPGTAGCDLTTNGILGAQCQNTTAPAPAVLPVAVTVANITNPPLPFCGGGPPPVATNCWTNLPPGYQTSPYTFYSIYYQPAAGQNYVVTFVPPPIITAANPAPGFVTLPGANGAQVGLTLSDLFSQLKNLGLSPLSYGTVTTIGLQNFIVTSTISGGAQSTYFSYAVPTSVKPGSIAMISAL
jgi:hypothetical protein